VLSDVNYFPASVYYQFLKIPQTFVASVFQLIEMKKAGSTLPCGISCRPCVVPSLQCYSTAAMSWAMADRASASGLRPMAARQGNSRMSSAFLKPAIRAASLSLKLSPSASSQSKGIDRPYARTPSPTLASATKKARLALVAMPASSSAFAASSPLSSAASRVCAVSCDSPGSTNPPMAHQTGSSPMLARFSSRSPTRSSPSDVRAYGTVTAPPPPCSRKAQPS